MASGLLTGAMTRERIAALPGVQQVERSQTRISANDLSRVSLQIAADTVATNNYLDLTGTNVLVTTWKTPQGWVVVRDALTMGPSTGSDSVTPTLFKNVRRADIETHS